MAAGTVVVGILAKAVVVAVVGLLAHAVLAPALRHLSGRGKRARRSTLDRLERVADEQPAVRIVVADGAGRRAIEPVRLAGTRSVAGGSVLECLHDDGRVIQIDSAAIIAIEEL